MQRSASGLQERLDRVLPEEVSTTTSFSSDALADVARREGAEGKGQRGGQGPWQIAWRRLRRSKVSLAFGAVFIVVALMCMAAPLYSEHVAHTGPLKNHLTDKVTVDGKEKDVVSPDGIAIGPTWQGEFLLGADGNGRDTAVRLLYGGRNSLLIGLGAALLTALLAVIVGILSGFYRGWVDSIFSRALDVIWAFPVILLGVALGTALSLGGLSIGPLKISSRLADDPGPDHRGRLRALHGQADPRAGPGLAREGVRRGGRGPGRRRPGGSCAPRSCPTSPRRSSSSCRC